MNHRTAVIVAASIAAVVFAAAIAVGVDLGILTISDSKPVGQLTTATVAQQSVAQPEKAFAAQKAPGKTRQRATQTYVIKKAGVVKVAYSKKAVRFVSASAKRHWTWKLAQTGDRKLTVTFQHGSDTYTFVAAIGRHGKLTAKVDHPVTRVIPSSSGSSTTWASAAPAPPPAPAVSGGDGEGGHNGGGEADD